MKTESDVYKACRARHNQLRRHIEQLRVLATFDPNLIDGTDIGDMREEVERISQCFHEFSAYWNVVKT